jgi:hypothetical protein
MRHQKLTRKFQNGPPRLERLALARLREQFPGLRRAGFSRAVHKACEGEIPGRHIGINPDGWFEQQAILRSGESRRTFTCIEIEDRHLISPQKLWRYCDLYDTLDSFDHFLRLLVFDRYGLNQRELDLAEIYLTGLVDLYGPRAHWR